MSIVEKLGGKPGQQTISEVVSSGKSSSSVPFIGNIDEFLSSHSDSYKDEVVFAWIEDNVTGEPETHYCFEVDEEAFNILNEPFVCVYSDDSETSPIKSILQNIVSPGEIKSVPLDPAEYKSTTKVVTSAANFVSIRLYGLDGNANSYIFKKGTLRTSWGTKGQNTNPII